MIGTPSVLRVTDVFIANMICCIFVCIIIWSKNDQKACKLLVHDKTVKMEWNT